MRCLAGLLMGVVISSGSLAGEGGAPDIPVTGRENPDLASFDRMMLSVMREHQPPGGALAVTCQGRLVYARGFGYADVESRQPVRPESLFRIASISKPITAAAILQLVERGRLRPEDNAFPLLGLKPALENAAQYDKRLDAVTLLDLLQHAGGWDTAKSPDPMFLSVKIADSLGTKPPAEPQEIIRWVLGRPLDFTPGERYAYSNFGYCVLGRVIEKAAGQRYEDYVRREVLGPLGIHEMRIGRTLESQRAEGEVKYYAPKPVLATGCVGPALGHKVPPAYGQWYQEALDAHGGWIGSAVDLARFAGAFDSRRKCPILGAASLARMFAPPAFAAAKDGRRPETYYGCGWNVRPIGNLGLNTWHAGRLGNCCATLLVCRYDGLCWAVLFNTDAEPKGKFLIEIVDPLVHQAADAVKRWPPYDLFKADAAAPVNAGERPRAVPAPVRSAPA
jgi:N-acyl-D-amino-acid deacylase